MAQNKPRRCESCWCLWRVFWIMTRMAMPGYFSWGTLTRFLVLGALLWPKLGGCGEIRKMRRVG